MAMCSVFTVFRCVLYHVCNSRGSNISGGGNIKVIPVYYK